jgi:mono/diheme cytochrome c family protein
MGAWLRAGGARSRPYLGRRRRVRGLGREGQASLYPCWQCHGTQAQGGVTGPKLAPDPMPIEPFTAFVRTTNRGMPPYLEAILSNEDLEDIHAYLQTIPKPADYKSIPLLNQ